MSKVKIKYIVIVVFLIGFSNLVFSQNSTVSGYLGKRAMIEYNNYLAPNMFTSGIEGSPFIHSINFHYILKRRFQMGVNYEKYKFEANGGSSFNFDYNLVNGNAFGLNFDWYRKGLLAPVGLYFRVGTKVLFGEFTEIRENKLVTDSYTHFACTLEYGIRRVFYDKVVFNVGGSFGDVLGLGIETQGYKTTLGGIYMIRFHVGLGVLLF